MTRLICECKRNSVILHWEDAKRGSFCDNHSECQFHSEAPAFLIELRFQILKKISAFSNSVIAHMLQLDPEHALQDNKPSIVPLAVNFPAIVTEHSLEHLSDQWRELSCYSKDLWHLINEEPAPAFWLALWQITDETEKPKCGCISRTRVVFFSYHIHQPALSKYSGKLTSTRRSKRIKYCVEQFQIGFKPNKP